MDDMRETTMLSIKDFSDLTRKSPTTLRYYDEIGLLIPAARGENNYRYYAPRQIMTVNFINVMAELGVPLSKIKEIIDSRTPRSIMELLETQEDMLDAELNKLRTTYSILHAFRKNILTGLSADENFIGVIELDEARLIEGPPNDFKDSETYYFAFINLYDSAGEYRINPSYPVGGIHDSMESFLKSPSKPDRFYSADPYGVVRRPAGKYLVGYQRGYYGQFDELPGKLEAYANENGLVCEGPVYSRYLLNEVSVAVPDNYLAQVMVRVDTKKT
ncbi:MAG: MerR family transcriptional regulator [Defluviitaleaceae bacterium]|nr:MerR family transcriptional regulator [Defluviitaleaceae bacterium]